MYQHGFGNEHLSEALPGSVPARGNTPQQPPRGLYPEQITATSFTQPREVTRRTWMYRIMPSAAHPPYRRIDDGTLRTAPFDENPPSPNRHRWDPMPLPTAPTDFIDGLFTLGGNGDVAAAWGIAIHLYRANKSMPDRCFLNADGEMLLIPEQGRLHIRTELGVLELRPGEIGVLPRGIKFSVDVVDGQVRGYVCENYGEYLALPERGPIGVNGLASERHFLVPTAAYDDTSDDVELVQKFAGNLWSTELDHSPLDVVAWHGTHVPYKYDLANFMAVGSVSFDCVDPSVFTVLTSPTTSPGLANVDFVAFPSRWVVGEDTFRPPYFHRNCMSEFMGLIHGVYDAKAEGFLPGGASLHNSYTGHGPDAETFTAARNADLVPQKLDNTLAFMFETAWPVGVTTQGLEADFLQSDYDHAWAGLPTLFEPSPQAAVGRH